MSYSKSRQIKRHLINIYHSLGIDKIFMFAVFFDKEIYAALRKFQNKSELSDSQLRKDIKSCY